MLESVKHELNKTIESLKSQLQETNNNLSKCQEEFKQLEIDFESTKKALTASEENGNVLKNKLEETEREKRSKEQFIEKIETDFKQKASEVVCVRFALAKILLF